MSGRVYARKFDWDEARRLHGEGVPYSEIARRLGVSFNAVYRVVRPGEDERQAAYQGRWQQTGRCDDCGGPMNRLSRSHGSTRCRDCAQKDRVKADEDGNLYCPSCDTWKPPDAFYRKAAATHRGRSSECRSCSNGRRRANRERERAYQQARHRRARQLVSPKEGTE